MTKTPYYQHLSDYFRLTFTGKEGFEDSALYTQWTTSLPIFNFNGILTKQELDPSTLEKSIAAFQKLGLPHWWILHEKGTVSKYLEEKGYRCFGHLGFVSRDLTSGLPEFHCPHERVHVRRVSNDRDLKLWSEVVCRAFFPDHAEKAAAFLYEPYQKIGYGEEAPLSHYIGYLDGEPVGGSTLVMTNGTLAGLWNAGVLEKGRRHGVGTEMAAARIREAAARGAKTITSILMPDGMAWSYCRPFGFTETFKAYPYLPDVLNV